MDLLYKPEGLRPAVRSIQKVRDLAVVIKQLTTMKGKKMQQKGYLQKQDQGKNGQELRTKKYGDVTE